MKIFEQEKTDGLSEQLTASASITYASAVAPSADHNKHNIKEIKSLASLNDSDLYYVQSILVSSSWNKNDDIFDKDEVWAARNTPEDKPTNLEHDEATIIGHITSNWPITEDGSLIDQATATENLPEKYHILTGSVIYKGFSNIDLKNRADKLIAEIENGTKYVSMECFFKNFDYGLINKSTGEYKILPRNEATAYLTKYLRSYGGQGEHDDYKIGRVLRNITFSGKGFVDKPANPDSIIFTKNMFEETDVKNLNEKIEDLSIAGVFDNKTNLNVENNIMNLENIQAEVAELKTKIEAMTSSSAEVVSQLKDKVAALETEVQAKEQTIAELTAAQEALAAEKEEAAKKMKEEEEKNEVEDKKESKKEEDKEEETEAAKKKMKAEMDAKDEEMKKTKSDLEAALETIAGYKMKEEKMAKKEKKMKRASALMENGLDADTANATADKFESMDDETFAAMTSLFAGKMPPWLEKIKKRDDEQDKEDEKEKAAKKDKETEEDTVDASVLETAEVESGVNLGVGGEAHSGVEATRAALVEFVSSRLGKKH
jgi:hypothetical protein